MNQFKANTMNIYNVNWLNLFNSSGIPIVTSAFSPKTCDPSPLCVFVTIFNYKIVCSRWLPQQLSEFIGIEVKSGAVKPEADSRCSLWALTDHMTVTTSEITQEYCNIALHMCTHRETWNLGLHVRHTHTHTDMQQKVAFCGFSQDRVA